MHDIYKRNAMYPRGTIPRSKQIMMSFKYRIRKVPSNCKLKY